MTSTDDSQPKHSSRMHGDGKLSYEEYSSNVAIIFESDAMQRIHF